ncbi:hypothetical protein [Porphyrobacter sp. LM 6]|uniref:hypothetical protein n=1 Tax=Porphyrobacter sp. LM 6 TaxID=1896196 RepID=UPI0008478DFB|nr:hypothetical protein [Porphyrobacter sp. LM 6]AOL93524.1 hypothetical protein BG023_11571 [Porphyrobacter sp. LM 6]
MTSGQQDETGTRTERKTRKRRSRSLTAHRAFAPMLGLWGAALAGLSAMVLPAALFAPLAAMIADLAGASLPLVAVKAATAGLAALLLGGVLYAIARRPSRAARSDQDEAAQIIAAAGRRIRPIDPQRELGSASLDTPVTDIPFAAMREDELVVPVIDEPAAVPQELELAEFAAMPGRNAVWVVEDVVSDDLPAESVVETPTESSIEHDPSPVSEPVALAPASEPRPAYRRDTLIAPPGAAALAQLRAQPPEQLSLIQMVERFAGALYEHRTAPPGRAMSAQDLAAREAALTEALKALAALSDGSTANGGDTSQDEPLRTALGRLQEVGGLRGAA